MLTIMKNVKLQDIYSLLFPSSYGILGDIKTSDSLITSLLYCLH